MGPKTGKVAIQRDVGRSIWFSSAGVATRTRRPPTDDVVADPGSLELQILGIWGALHLESDPPERDRGSENHPDHQKQNYQDGAHGRNDNPTRSSEHIGRGCGWSSLPLLVAHEPSYEEGGYYGEDKGGRGAE